MSAIATAAVDVDGSPAIGELIGEKYRLSAILGRGGMSVVYRATHELTGKTVAIKFLLPEQARASHGASERFLREAQAAGRVNHANVVDVYDVGTHLSGLYLVMEFLHGEPLSDLVGHGPMDVVDAVRILLPTMRGIAAAHARGVIHRDLKPENIFLCADADGSAREPKVLDFGISKLLSDEPQSLSLTMPGGLVGTPYYMPPEQIRGSSDVDARADIYALGVILYEMLTGHPPFDAETYSALMVKIATETPVPVERAAPPGVVSGGLGDVVRKAMARSPDQRFPTVAALAVALEPFSEGMRFHRSGDVWPKGRSSDSQRAPTPSSLADPLALTLDRVVEVEVDLTTLRPPTRKSRALWLAASAAVVIATTTAVGLLTTHGTDASETSNARTPRDAPVRVAALENERVGARGAALETAAVLASDAPRAPVADALGEDAGVAPHTSVASSSSPARQSAVRGDRHTPREPTAVSAAPAPAGAESEARAAQGRTGRLTVDDF